MESSSPERSSAIRRIDQVATMAALALVVVGCFVILRPFISALLWAGIVCYSSWPLYTWLTRVLRGRRQLAAGIMVAISALVLVMPFAVVGARLAGNRAQFMPIVAEILQTGLPPAPAWLQQVPVIGVLLAERWTALAADPERTAAYLKEVLTGYHSWFLRRGLDVTQGVLQLSLSVLVSFFFYRDGETVVRKLSESARRLAGDRAQRLIALVGRTVRGVVYGVLGTALGQGIVAGIGFEITGVPSPLLLGLLVFFLSVVPFGPPLVWVPATLWLYFHAGIGSTLFMAAWGALGISGIDNLLRPYLISRETQQPFVLMLLGVLGGVLAFGFIGFFIGPTLLAVGYSLISDWSGGSKDEHSAPGSGAPWIGATEVSRADGIAGTDVAGSPPPSEPPA
jgi:predicted PurR-regulated permease PerM